MRIALRTAVFLILLPLAAPAQEEAPPLRGPVGARVEQFKKVKMMDELQFGEELSIRFLARYNKYVETVREIAEKKNACVDQLAMLSRKAGASDADIQKVVKDLLALDLTAASAKETYLTGLREILTENQIARYLVFERNFYRDLREILRDLQRERQGQRR